MGPNDPRIEATDDLDVLLAALPPEIVAAVHALPDRTALIEVVMDLGRRPEARYPASEVTLLEREVVDADLQWVVDHIGSFGDDNRAGIERTLHRISAIRNRSGKVVGLTCRIGRAVHGTIEIIADFVESGRSILILGRPGIGKTTMLREAARVLADEHGKRVVVVDTSNEIAGDGDIPHPAIGKARRMQVRTPSLQHEVMIEAVENHMPQVIVIDEIGTELEAQAARTIAERGVQLIGTAHGNNLDNLMLNPTLSDLIGGIQSVTLGDDEARRRRSQKSVLERKAPPTFDVIVEIQDRERVLVHADVAQTIDQLLLGDPIAPELRWRDEEGVHRSQARPRPTARDAAPAARFSGLTGTGAGAWGRETGWRGGPSYRPGPPDEPAGARSSYRPGQSGGWRAGRGGGREPGHPGGAGRSGILPGERFAVPPSGPRGAPERSAPFVAAGLADRGPVERAEEAALAAEVSARDARELARQEAWRSEARRAIETLREEEGTRPVNAALLERTDEEERLARSVPGELGDDEAEEDDDGYGAAARALEGGILRTIRVFPHGISRKRLEQAIRDLQLPVVVARDPDDADVVMTLRSEYRQKPPAVRDAEERGLPVYVLKANTVAQMEASLTSVFALEIDPREAAVREAEQAIDAVVRSGEAIELAPQAPYIRRLQHQVAERANLVSRSRGREPYRRVRIYPDAARTAWR